MNSNINGKVMIDMSSTNCIQDVIAYQKSELFKKRAVDKAKFSLDQNKKNIFFNYMAKSIPGFEKDVFDDLVRAYQLLPTKKYSFRKGLCL